MYSNSNENQMPRYQTLLIIWVSFLASIVLYVGITEFVIFSKHESVSTGSLFYYVFLGLAIVEVLAIPFIKGLLSKPHWKTGEDIDYGEVKLAKQQKFTTSHIVAYAISESAALYGVALAFAQHADRMAFYTFIAIAVFALLMNCPSRIKWDSIDGTR